MYENVHSSIIHNSLKHKANVCQRENCDVYTKTLYSNKSELQLNNIDKSYAHKVEWNKSHTKYMLYDSIYIELKIDTTKL